MTVLKVKKEPLSENTVNYSENGVQLSLEREVLHEIWTNFPGDIEKRISENFAEESMLKVTVFSKLKKRKKFLSGSAKCNWT